MCDLEVGKFLVVPEFKVSNTPDSFPDHLVEGDDSRMDGGVSDGKQVNNILSIAREFLHSVGESKDGCSNCPIPGNSPVASILDLLGGLNRSKSDLEFTKLFNLGIVMGGGELPTEYCVKVNCPPCDNVLPETRDSLVR